MVGADCAGPHSFNDGGVGKKKRCQLLVLDLFFVWGGGSG